MDEIINVPLVDHSTDYEIFGDNEYDSIEIPKTLLSSRLLKGNTLFAIEIKDNSANDALLLPRDLVILLKLKTQPKHGDFVAYQQNNQIKFKYFFKQKNGYKLRSVHPSIKDEEISSSDNIKIIGKVVLVIRSGVSDLPLMDEEPPIRINNQFLSFHETIKSLIYRRRRAKLFQAIILFVVAVAVFWSFLNIFVTGHAGVSRNGKTGCPIKATSF